MGYDGAGKIMSNIGMYSHIGDGRIVYRCSKCGSIVGLSGTRGIPKCCGQLMKEARVKE